MRAVVTAAEGVSTPEEPLWQVLTPEGEVIQLAGRNLRGPPGATILGHYGKPPEGCDADEKAFQISGVPGMVSFRHHFFQRIAQNVCALTPPMLFLPWM